MGHWMYLFVYLLVCFMYLFPSELVSLPGRRCGRFGREGGMRTAAGNTHQPAHNLEKSEKKHFGFHNFEFFFIGAKSDLCLAGSVSQSVALLRLDACDPGV